MGSRIILSRRNLVVGLVGASAISTCDAVGAQASSPEEDSIVNTLEALFSTRNSELIQSDNIRLSRISRNFLHSRSTDSCIQAESLIGQQLAQYPLLFQASNLPYVDAETSVNASRTSIRGNVVEVKFQTLSTFHRAHGNNPMKQRAEWVARFYRTPQGLKLGHVKPDDNGARMMPINHPSTTSLDAEKVHIRSVITSVQKQELSSFLNSELSLADCGQAGCAPYADRSKVQSYVRKYALNPNDEYRYIKSGIPGFRDGNDCTNFISQALHHGGWIMLDGTDTENWSWWYDHKNIDEWTHTWAVAERFYYHATAYSKRLKYIPHNDIWVGDIINVKFHDESQINHTMAVSERARNADGSLKEGWGGILLAYHSNDTLDSSIWEFAAKAPLATYYPMRLL